MQFTAKRNGDLGYFTFFVNYSSLMGWGCFHNHRRCFFFTFFTSHSFFPPDVRTLKKYKYFQQSWLPFLPLPFDLDGLQFHLHRCFYVFFFLESHPRAQIKRQSSSKKTKREKKRFYLLIPNHTHCIHVFARWAPIMLYIY